MSANASGFVRQRGSRGSYGRAEASERIVAHLEPIAPQKDAIHGQQIHRPPQDCLPPRQDRRDRAAQGRPPTGEDWFEQFEKSRSADKKADLAKKICLALKVHTQIEEEVFYPAFIEATQDEDIHHEAIVEHDGAKKLIKEIERLRAGGRLLRCARESALRDDQAPCEGRGAARRHVRRSEAVRHGPRWPSVSR